MNELLIFGIILFFLLIAFVVFVILMLYKKNNKEDFLIKFKDIIHNDLNTFSSNIREELNVIKKDNEDRISKINDRIEENFRRSNERDVESFGLIQEKISILDNNQKKFEDVSNQIIDFKNILTDKKTRGTFGEYQLESIISDIMSKNTYVFQYTLSNNTRADCIIRIPNSNFLVIDSKFPLENYKKMNENNDMKSDNEKKFKIDIKKHIDDISKKYIIANETTEYALLFLPAESIFSDLHSNFVDIIEYAKIKKVWIVSPNTVMAFVFTLNSIIKNENTKEKIDVIEQNLIDISKDFIRYEKRLENFFKHYEQLNEDINQLRISGNKLITKFKKIEDFEED